jgi:hypothetical protein
MKTFKLNRGLALLVAFSASGAQALEAPSLKDAVCGKQAQRLAKKWGISGKWRGSAPDMDGGTSFRSPTRDFGAWVVARWLPGGRVQLSRHSPGSLLQASWVGGPKDCVPMLQTSTPPLFAREAAGSWTDARLEKVVKTGHRGFVYLWSPHMPYSVRGLEELPALKKKLGSDAEIVVMLDPAAHQADAEATMREYKFPRAYLSRFNSMELYMRDALIHAPSLLPFAGKKLGSKLLPGYLNAADMEAFIKKEWSTL